MPDVFRNYFHPFICVALSNVDLSFPSHCSVSIYFLIDNETLASCKINSYLLCMETHCFSVQLKNIYVETREGVRAKEQWREEAARICRLPQRYTRASIEIRNKSKLFDLYVGFKIVLCVWSHWRTGVASGKIVCTVDKSTRQIKAAFKNFSELFRIAFRFILEFQ